MKTSKCGAYKVSAIFFYPSQLQGPTLLLPHILLQKKNTFVEQDIHAEICQKVRSVTEVEKNPLEFNLNLNKKREVCLPSQIEQIQIQFYHFSYKYLLDLKNSGIEFWQTDCCLRNYTYFKVNCSTDIWRILEEELLGLTLTLYVFKKSYQYTNCLSKLLSSGFLLLVQDYHEIEQFCKL